MAKFVIAGPSNCPYFARAELLADNLARNLPHFNIHKEVRTPDEWEEWLAEVCAKRNWQWEKSPLVWRELVDRGGKGVLIGGANEFQEYVKGYYDITSEMTSVDMTKVSSENKEIKDEIDQEEKAWKALSRPVKVCISSAASPDAYHMLSDLAKGYCLGKDKEIALTLFDKDVNELKGIEYEVTDLACPLMRNITCTSDLKEACTDSEVVVILDDVPKFEYESNEDWHQKNIEHFTKVIQTIESFAHKDVKVLVAGRGPVNFYSLIMLENSDLPKKNIVAMSRMVENHAKAVLAERLKVNSSGVVDTVIWGNPTGTYLLDASRARVHGYDGAIWGPPTFSVDVCEMVADDKWLETEFLEQVAKRKGQVEEHLQQKESLAFGTAIACLLSHWCIGGPNNNIYSLGIYSDGSAYDLPEGIVFSLPVRFDTPGDWTLVTDIKLQDLQKAKFSEAIQDLLEYRYILHPEVRPVVELPPAVEEPQEQQFGLDAAAAEDPRVGLERITEDKEGEEVAQTTLTPRPDGAPSQGDASQEAEGGEQVLDSPHGSQPPASGSPEPPQDERTEAQQAEPELLQPPKTPENE